MKFARLFVIHIVLLAGVIGIFEITDIDINVQDHFYLWDMHRWAVDRHELILRLIFYTGPKAMLIILGIVSAVIFMLSFKDYRYRNYREKSLLLLLSLIVVPLFISSLKTMTRVNTPNEITRYGGRAPYVKVLESRPSDYTPRRHGEGWPAGHASGGFSLMVLFFVFRERLNRMLGLLIGIVAGWAMGLYQTVNGQHYLSHTIISMQISWLLILIMNYFVSRIRTVHAEG